MLSVKDGDGVVNSSSTFVGNINPRYRGYYNDTESGFYYLQTRYYDPAIGRFLSADTFATTDINGLLSTNMFSYCENNPVNRSDPSGEWFNTVIGAIIGGISAVVTRDKENESVAQALLRGTVTGLVAGLALDVTIATAGAGSLIIGSVVAGLSSAGNTAWEQINTHGNVYDPWGVIADGIVGTGMNALFGASGREITREAGKTIKEIFHAINQNTKKSCTTKAGAFNSEKTMKAIGLNAVGAGIQTFFSNLFGTVIDYYRY